MQMLTEQLGLKVLPSLRPRYNIAPSQLVVCVWTNPKMKDREFLKAEMGLVPSLHSVENLSVGCLCRTVGTWENQGEMLETCTLITTVSNACVTPIHDRMPVILPEPSYASWLSPGLNNTIYLSGLLEPCQAEEMEAFPISALVNNPRHEDSRCIHPLE